MNEEVKFVQIPPETVEILSESVGISSLGIDIAQALSEDASYRCREIVHLCSQLLRHGKRQKLTTTDLSRAFRWYDADPIYGQGSKSNCEFIKIPEADIYIPNDDKSIDLAKCALDSEIITGTESPVRLIGSWVSLDGVSVVDDEKDVKYLPSLESCSKSLIVYYTTLTQSILYDKEDYFIMILKDMETNSKIGKLLPFFISFINNGCQSHGSDIVFSSRLLHLMKALITNPYLNFSSQPYISILVSGLLSILLVNKSERENMNIWKFDVVPLACYLLRHLYDSKTSSSNISLRSQILRTLSEYSSDTQFLCCSEYGRLSGLIALGPQVLKESLLPRLNETFFHVSSRLLSSSSFSLSSIESQNNYLDILSLLFRASTCILTAEFRGNSKETPDTKKNIYFLLYEHFGDALSVLPLAPLKNLPLPKLTVISRMKMKIKKCGDVSISSSSSSSSNDFFSSHSQKHDVVFSSSQNFDILADMGVPNDIFDDPLSDNSLFSFRQRSSYSQSNDFDKRGEKRNGSIRQFHRCYCCIRTLRRHGNEDRNEICKCDGKRLSLSSSVMEAFETRGARSTVLRYPQIHLAVGHPYSSTKLKRREFSDVRDDFKSKRNSFISKMIGHSSERSRILRLYSCSLYHIL